MSGKFHSLALLSAGLAGFFVWLAADPAKYSSGSLPHSAYVWQRDWNRAVTGALRDRAAPFEKLIVLGAEIGWESGRAKEIRVAVDYEALRGSGRPIGLAVRIGAYSGSFAANNDAFRSIARMVNELIEETRAGGLQPVELQIDFDCPDRKLEHYRRWLEALKSTVAIPITITALPSWLNQSRAFARLIESVDGYVLQVHSLERPRNAKERLALCEPARARAAVEQAAKFKKPFAVALPTYSYLLAFDSAGNFSGIGAENSLLGGKGSGIVELRSSPEGMAELVRGWNSKRPEALRGVIWYRLPIATDRLNWAWPTLEMVIRGENPVPHLGIKIETAAPNYHEITLRNDGAEDYRGPAKATVRWRRAALTGADGLGDFHLSNRGRNEIELAAHELRIAPKSEQKIGWLRTEHEEEVIFEKAFSIH